MNIANSFDIPFILVNVCLTYIIIKIIDYLNGDRCVPTLVKRLILVCSIIIVTLIYVYIGHYDNYIKLFNSAVATPVAWSWILKPICSKLGIDYKYINNTLN